MKKTAVLLCVLGLCFSICSCSGKTGDTSDQSESVQTYSGDENVSVSSESGQSAPSEKDENYISPERKNDDYDKLNNSAKTLLESYYAGISDEDYGKWKKVFPDFYLKAMEEEGKEYNQTNEEFLKEINSTNKTDYGNDYYAYAEEPAILQLTDVSLEVLKEELKETFGVDADLRDAYSVNFNSIVRGSLNKTSNVMEFFMLDIGGTYYLYDQYYSEMIYQES